MPNPKKQKQKQKQKQEICDNSKNVMIKPNTNMKTNSTDDIHITTHKNAIKHYKRIKIEKMAHVNAQSRRRTNTQGVLNPNHNANKDSKRISLIVRCYALLLKNNTKIEQNF